MAEKALTEAAWKTHARGKGYKDAALLKALADFARAERESPAARVRCLDALDKQADALLKANKADKELAAYVAEMAKAADRARKAAEQAAAAAEAAGKAAEKAAAKPGDDGEDDDEASPALLTTRMLPLLRLVLKGEPMHAMVASAGKQVVVLLSRKPVAGSKRKILADQLEGAGSIKYFAGQCLREDGATTFVLQTQVAGLSKKLKAALLAQTGLRVNKLRCRGIEGDTDEDEDAPPLVAQAEGPGSGAGPAAPSVVELGRARIAWGEARAHAVSEVARLKTILQAEYRDAADEQEALAKALQRLDATIASMDEALGDQLDAIVAADPGERATLAAAAKATVDRLAAFVSSDEILATIDGNELAPEMKVAEPLRDRLRQLGAALG